MRVPGVSSNRGVPSSSTLTLGTRLAWFCATLRTKMRDGSFKLFCCVCDVSAGGAAAVGRRIFPLLLRVCEGGYCSQRTGNGRLAGEWLVGFATIQRAGAPNVAWPELTGRVVRRWGARGVHQRRYAAFGRNCLPLLGLLRLRRLLDRGQLLRRLADDRRKDEEEDRNGQSSAKKNQLALADSFDSLDVSSGRELRSGLLVAVETLRRGVFNVSALRDPSLTTAIRHFRSYCCR